MDLIKRSPYHHKFAELGAQFVDRIGFAAPLVFSSTEEEHLATRSAVGLFDVYYQVAIDVAGPDAEAFLQQMLVADVARLDVGRVVYASVCNQAGGMVDDLTCFRLAPDQFWLFPTPSRVFAVVEMLMKHKRAFGVVVTNLGYKSAYLSVQGPKSRELLARVADGDLSGTALPYFSFTRMTVADVPEVLVSRTGYSGELGYELVYPVEYAEHLWSRVFAAGADLGVKPCGLGALRTLRLEKKYVLYGLDANDTTSPIECGLSWTVKLQKPDFIGKQALEKQKREGTERQLVLMEFDAMDFVPPVGASINIDGREVGKVTSADRGYAVGKSLALGFVPTALAADDQPVSVGSPDGTRAAKIRLKAVYDPEGHRLRQ